MSKTDHTKHQATQRMGLQRSPEATPSPESDLHHPLAQTPLPSAVSLPHLSALPHITGYEILDEIGRGGMGVVYRATHLGLKRTVAIKMLPTNVAMDAHDAARFCSEAEAVAAIHHANVVKVFEYSSEHGRPYLVMEYLPGGTLAEYLELPMSVTDAAALVELLARGIQAAHDQGIVHRDLKPGNILFDGQGQPRITDFGLAKRAASDLTNTQMVMGTPAYMAPEQASGRTKYAGPAADIYALGVILYECLTQQTPFGKEGESWEILHRVLHDAIRPPSQLRPDVPKDLEWICLCCLEKDPRHRYATADALADDLLRFLRGESVSVRPPGRLEKLARWAKRRPSAAAAYALTVVVIGLVCFGSVLLSLWLRSVASQKQTEEANAALVDANAVVVHEKAKVELARTEAEAARDQLSLSLTNETKARTALAQTQNELVTTKYFFDVSLAYREAMDRNALRANRLLEQCSKEQRGWAWWHTYRTIHPEIAHFTLHDCSHVGFTNDPRRLVVRCGLGEWEYRDADSGQFVPVPNAPRFALASNLLQQHVISIDGTRVFETLCNPDVPVEEQLKSTKNAGSARLWDLTTGKLLKRFDGFDGDIFEGCLSLDGSTALVMGHGEDGRITAVDLKKGTNLPQLPFKLRGFPDCSLSADGRLALASTLDENRYIQYTIWEPRTGAIKQHFRPANSQIIINYDKGALSPDGTTVVFIRNGGDVGFWTVGQPESSARFQNSIHTGGSFKIAFSPDSRYCATVGEGGEIALWHTQTGELIRRYHGLRTKIEHLGFDAQSRRLLAKDKSDECIVWDVNQVGPVLPYPRIGRSFIPVSVSDDAARMAVNTSATGLVIQERATNRQSSPNEPYLSALHELCFQPGGKLLAVAVSGMGVDLCDGFTGQRVRSLPLPKITHESLSFSRNGQRLIAIQNLEPFKSEIVIWAVESGEVVRRIPTQNCDVVAISGDGKRVAVCVFGFIQVHDVETGRTIAHLESGLRSSASWDRYSIALNEDGSLLAHSIVGWQIHLSRVPAEVGDQPVKLTVHRELVAHTATVRSLAFSRFGHRLLSGSDNSVIKVWDTKSGLEAIGLKLPQNEPVHRVFYSADENQIIAIGSHSGATIFDGSPIKK